MKMLIIFVFFILISTKSFCLGLFELIAVSSSAPILYNQYFDESLNKKSEFQKKKEILTFHINSKKTKKNQYIPQSRPDLIKMLNITEELNLINKYY